MKIKETVIKRTFAKVLINIVRYAFFISLSYILLYPFFYILANALMSFSDSYDVTVTWVPKTLYFGNLVDAFKVFDVKSTAMRSFVYEIIGGLIQFCSTAVAAYGMARFNLKGKKLLFGIKECNL